MLQSGYGIVKRWLRMSYTKRQKTERQKDVENKESRAKIIRFFTAFRMTLVDGQF